MITDIESFVRSEACKCYFLSSGIVWKDVSAMVDGKAVKFRIFNQYSEVRVWPENSPYRYEIIA